MYDTVLPFALGIGLDTLQILLLITDHTGGVRLGMRSTKKRHQQQVDSSHLPAVLLLAFISAWVFNGLLSSFSSSYEFRLIRELLITRTHAHSGGASISPKY